MTMSLGPHAPFIVTCYLAAALVIASLIAWVAFDYRSQRQRLSELDKIGITRRSGRSAADMR